MEFFFWEILLLGGLIMNIFFFEIFKANIYNYYYIYLELFIIKLIRGNGNLIC